MVTGMAGENDEQFVRTSTSASARSKTVRAPRRAARRRVTMRPPTPLALSGLWSAVSCGDGRTVMPNKPLDGVIEPGMLENSDTGIGMAHTASVEERELRSSTHYWTDTA